MEKYMGKTLLRIDCYSRKSKKSQWVETEATAIKKYTQKAILALKQRSGCDAGRFSTCFKVSLKLFVSHNDRQNVK